MQNSIVVPLSCARKSSSQTVAALQSKHADTKDLGAPSVITNGIEITQKCCYELSLRVSNRYIFPALFELFYRYYCLILGKIQLYTKKV